MECHGFRKKFVLPCIFPIGLIGNLILIQNLKRLKKLYNLIKTTWIKSGSSKSQLEYFWLLSPPPPPPITWPWPPGCLLQGPSRSSQEDSPCSCSFTPRTTLPPSQVEVLKLDPAYPSPVLALAPHPMPAESQACDSWQQGSWKHLELQISSDRPPAPRGGVPLAGLPLSLRISRFSDHSQVSMAIFSCLGSPLLPSYVRDSLLI